MSDVVTERLVALLPPLLRALETLGFIARHFHPPDFGAVMDAAGTPDDDLRAARQQTGGWPDELAGVRERFETAANAALAAFEGLRNAPDQADGIRAVFRALRYLPRAKEALYPLAGAVPAINRYFLDPALREDVELTARFAAPPPDGTGVMHAGNEPGSRGGYSLYVPEFYTPDRAWPVVMALHGGSGNGRNFLWSWLRDARSHGAIVVAPTATGPTWALMGEDTDTPNLVRILDAVRSRWTIDASRMLLTGMSDGGTFCYVTGLEDASPFTHLAPVSATFHPLMAEMASPDRLRGLPVYLVHGALDWMFQVEVARQTHHALAAAGADIVYRELDDLSHCYPDEINAAMLAWLRGE
ncbi:phospholipase [Bradyrhizobium sp.]|jgi:phospholipase/carboxylesterase|uniref:carboxylesterase family protein n=1 Tax=Bradyrhizobium sp. TaxID=376 RepID=UPI002E01699C|nr:phospholipase [Bradyrhizobium sp.]